ncbi:hypothetical protein DSO57_1009988 [Entomophthora muscae]|uniref:Uncharacterized protein n=1 Tax=Entomophthora muscae TaxID=34485 RepID=A0ACC2RLF8_9FUNG|nr:hypothetical protein DSO57_1009988 [Entomophthora muscae]
MVHGDLGSFQCLNFDIKRHISEGEYTYFWIKINPPGTDLFYNCEGISECCAADYCFEYIQSGWFSFDMKIKFPNKKKTIFSVLYNLGEMTNNGPWDYSSKETTCVDPVLALID